MRANDLPRQQRLALLEAIRTVESTNGRDEHEVGDGGESYGAYQIQVGTAAKLLQFCRFKKEPKCPLTPQEDGLLRLYLSIPAANEGLAHLQLNFCEQVKRLKRVQNILYCYRRPADRTMLAEHLWYVQRALPIYRIALKRLRRGR